MKTEEFNKALNHIDYDLVDEFVREREALEKRRVARRNIYRLVPVAACFVLFTLVGSIILASNMNSATKNEINNTQSTENLQMFLDKDGMFYFEYRGTLYQAYVSPLIEENTEFAENGSVSIQNVGERISDVTVIDESGNAATMEIYESKSNSNSGRAEILLKLDGGYFRAHGIK